MYTGDSILCDTFGRAAVDAAMAGRTDMLIALRHGLLIHVPLALVTRETEQLDPEGDLWLSVLATTGQPRPSDPRPGDLHLHRRQK